MPKTAHSVSHWLDVIEQGPSTDPEDMTDAELGDWWADTALKLAQAVRDDTTKVRVEYDSPDNFDRPQARVEAVLELPRWAEGDPAMAAGLCLFGHRHAVTDLNITAEIL